MDDLINASMPQIDIDLSVSFRNAACVTGNGDLSFDANKLSGNAGSRIIVDALTNQHKIPAAVLADNPKLGACDAKASLIGTSVSAKPYKP
ncbi:MAG TPA: hypothetical protein VFS88_04930 [Micavibrio sp.]|nr:hypothetical protein [Micavibrio sp.]